MFFLQALELQNDITNMMVPYGISGSITLEDICFQAPQTKQCVIQSVFQYFQNNQTILNKCLTLMGYECSNYSLTFDFFLADFHDHLLFCSRYHNCYYLFSAWFNLVPRAFSSFKMAGQRNSWPRLLNGSKNS